jgi:hypothetical protein
VGQVRFATATRPSILDFAGSSSFVNEIRRGAIVPPFTNPKRSLAITMSSGNYHRLDLGSDSSSSSSNEDVIIQDEFHSETRISHSFLPHIHLSLLSIRNPSSRCLHQGFVFRVFAIEYERSMHESSSQVYKSKTQLTVSSGGHMRPQRRKLESKYYHSRITGLEG